MTAYVTVLQGEPGETGPIYTRLLATDPSGPHAGALFLTSELYRNAEHGLPVFPIWKSSDSGRSWQRVGSVHDKHLAFGNRYQPALLELSQPLGRYSPGVLLLAGSSIPADLSETHLLLHASEDGGATWSYVSEIVSGGPAVYDPSPDAGTTAVWEPNLFEVDGAIVCVYADERHKDQSMLQVLVHKTTTDLTTWSEPVLDFGIADRQSRPGMFVSTGRLPDGTYAGVFEVVGHPDAPVFFARSRDGLDWGEPHDLGAMIVGQRGTILSGSPHIAWQKAPDGATNLLVTGRVAIEIDGTTSETALLAPAGGGPWRSVPLPVGAVRLRDGENSGYSQSVVWAPDGALVQATTIQNSAGSYDIVVGRTPVNHG